MKAYFNLPSETSGDCSIGFLLEAFSMLKVYDSWLGVELDDRTIMQIRPNKENKLFYIEVLNPKTLRVRWIDLQKQDLLLLFAQVITHRSPATLLRKVSKAWKQERLRLPISASKSPSSTKVLSITFPE